MPNRIDLVRAKAERAGEPIQALHEILERFRETQPYGIAIEEDAQAGTRVFKIDRIDEVPIEISLRCGDVIQGLRSTLDHLAYQLFLASDGVGEGRHIEYPICESAGAFEAKSDRSLRGIPEDARDAIRATRPYEGGDVTLVRIDRMSAIAKQRPLFTAPASAPPRLALFGSHVMAAIPRGATTPDLSDAPSGAGLRCPLKEGDVIHVQPLDEAPPEDLEVPVIVAFAEPGIIECKPVLRTLRQMTELVDDIIKDLATFL